MNASEFIAFWNEDKTLESRLKGRFEKESAAFSKIKQNLKNVKTKNLRAFPVFLRIPGIQYSVMLAESKTIRAKLKNLKDNSTLKSYLSSLASDGKLILIKLKNQYKEFKPEKVKNSDYVFKSVSVFLNPEKGSCSVKITGFSGNKRMILKLENTIDKAKIETVVEKQTIKVKNPDYDPEDENSEEFIEETIENTFETFKTVQKTVLKKPFKKLKDDWSRNQKIEKVSNYLRKTRIRGLTINRNKAEILDGILLKKALTKEESGFKDACMFAFWVMKSIKETSIDRFAKNLLEVREIESNFML